MRLWRARWSAKTRDPRCGALTGTSSTRHHLPIRSNAQEARSRRAIFLRLFLFIKSSNSKRQQTWKMDWFMNLGILRAAMHCQQRKTKPPSMVNTKLSRRNSFEPGVELILECVITSSNNSHPRGEESGQGRPPKIFPMLLTFHLPSPTPWIPAELPLTRCISC